MNVISQVTYNDADTLARLVYGEARGEPWAGQVAVATVAINRWRSGKWFAGDTIALTCTKPEQFSCFNLDDPNRAKLLAVTRADPVFQACWDAALTALAGPPVLSPRITHYKVAGTQAAWAEGQMPVAVIGHHEFYADIA